MVEGHIDVAANPFGPIDIELSVAATNRLLGTALAKSQMADLLRSIEFQVQDRDEDTLSVHVPSFRVDVGRPEDLMEEVARRVGYDQIPVTFPTIAPDTQPPNKLLTQRQSIRALLAGMGFSEIITYSFVHADSCKRLRLADDDARCRQLAILNPLSEDQTVMRTSLIPGLLETMRQNLSRQSRNLKLFETGRIFISNGHETQPAESDMLAGLWTGDRMEPDWYAKPEPCDFYDLKGAVEGLLAGLHVDPARFTRLADDQCAYTRPGASARILVNGQQVGIIGQLHPKVAEAFDLRQEAFIFEMDMHLLMTQIPDSLQSRPIPKFPSVARDATLIVGNTLEAGAILEQVRQMNESLVEEIRLFDVFEGGPIAPGRKSISLRIVYRSAEATLEDTAVNQLHKTITNRLVEQFKADLPT
jgi:phenylalanyl-tRNA synthetase beta chain